MRNYKITGMSCAACQSRVERAISSVKGVREFGVSFLHSRASVGGEYSESELFDAVSKAGYGISSVDKNNENVNNNLQKEGLLRAVTKFYISVILTAILMYFSMGYTMLSLPLPAFLVSNPVSIAVIEGVLALSVMLINFGFFRRGALGLVRLSPNMDTLISLGSLCAYVYSFAVTLGMIGADPSSSAALLHKLYYESAAMILVLITVGKMLETRAKGKTTGALAELLALSPKTCEIERDGRIVTVRTDEIKLSDVFVLRPGSTVPADGEVLEGESSISEAVLTGESIPVYKKPGDKVLAATVNGNGFMRCVATGIGEDTAIGEVIRLVENASSTKAPVARVADKVCAFFVPLVIGIAALTFTLWMIILGDITVALGRGISVLVISCPCALGLATPVAITVGSGVGAKLNILYKNAESLELCGRAGTVALDKTGTLTTGAPRVRDILPYGVSSDELLRCAYSLELGSEHPLSRAIVGYCNDKGVSAMEVKGFVALSGEGVRGELGSMLCHGGSFNYISTVCSVPDDAAEEYSRLAGEGKTPVLFSSDGKFIGIIAVSDTLRPDAERTVRELTELGIRVVMLSGDNKTTAEAVGAMLGITEVYAELMPADKEAMVRSLGDRVVMVGDGINDAPALTTADVGIAVGCGTDIALSSASVVLQRDVLSDVPRAIRLGRRVLKTVYENLGWAFVYNVACIPLAAGAFSGILGWDMNPMVCALAMSLSSIFVVGNALRLGNFIRREKRFYRDDGCCTIPENYLATNCNNEESEKGTMTYEFKIEGMMCPHCEARVKAVIEGFACVLEAKVSYLDGTATVTGKHVDPLYIKDEIENAGYKVPDFTEK